MTPSEATAYLESIDTLPSVSIKKLEKALKVISKFTKSISKNIEKLMDETAAARTADGTLLGEHFFVGEDKATIVKKTKYGVGSEELFDWFDIHFPGTVDRSPKLHWQTLAKGCRETDPSSISMLIKKGALTKTEVNKVVFV